MKDIFNRELQLGDYVVYPLQHYRGLGCGVVIQFTPKQIRIQLLGKEKGTLLQSSGCLCKVDGPEVTMHVLTIK